MEKYNNKNCPKCGGCATVKHDNLYDVLKRKCEDCGYSWNEKPLDSIEKDQRL